MSEEEFKEYVKETLSNINSKITKKEQGFINLLGNTFNDVCAENDELRQENTQLKKSLENAQEIYKNSHKYTSECEDKVIMLKRVLKEIRECIMNFLLTEEYIIVDGKAIANNYHKLLEIIDKGIGEDK